MSISSGKVIGSSGSRKPAESRRWLKPRVPREQLYRLSPAAPRPRRLGALEFTDRVRIMLRAWWVWLAVALVAQQFGHPYVAASAVIASFVFYNTSPESHPGVYPLDVHLDVNSEAFQDTLAGLTGMPIVAGNRVTLYNNGDEFFPAMLDAIDAAQGSVTMEQYIFWDGAVGRRFAEAFAERARRGVAVKLLVDAIGSSTLGREIFRILEAGGCQLAWYHPIHWYTVRRADFRDHRKSLIIDGRVAFTGGAGIADHWLGSAANPREWRDIQVRVEGPAAVSQQSGFAENWLETTGEILTGERYFPSARSVGSVKVQTILSAPSSGTGAVGTMYLTAVQCARREILIANPYFIPDGRVMELLAAARSRGVRIALMLAGPLMDSWWARQNSVRRYGRLLEAGVEIYEFRPTMLHQKTMIVDGAWVTVGTANFDNRSFALNEETNLCFHDRSIASELEAIFADDLRRCERVDLDRWHARGAWQRGKEAVAALIEDQL